jgi:hypothetical protein
VEDRLLPLE